MSGFWQLTSGSRGEKFREFFFGQLADGFFLFSSMSLYVCLQQNYVDQVKTKYQFRSWHVEPVVASVTTTFSLISLNYTQLLFTFSNPLFSLCLFLSLHLPTFLFEMHHPCSFGDFHSFLNSSRKHLFYFHLLILYLHSLNHFLFSHLFCSS